MLSLLFIVFAMAELLNPRKLPYTPEAHEYYHLSRVALQFSPPANDTTLHAIQSLVSIFLSRSLWLATEHLERSINGFHMLLLLVDPHGSIPGSDQAQFV